jgi:hypothetical protein
MIKSEHYHTDEIETSVASVDWVPVKTLEFEKDGFYKNIIKMHVTADLVVSPEETKGFMGFFINDEEKPRAVIESDLTFSHPFKTEFDLMSLPFGKHKFTVKMKSEQGYKVTNTFIEIYITRFYNIYEMVGSLTPMIILYGVSD